VDGTPGFGATSAELRPPPERNHFRNHLSETRGDGPTRPVTVSPWSRSLLRRRIDPSIVFTRWKSKVQSLQRPQKNGHLRSFPGWPFRFFRSSHHFPTTLHCPVAARGTLRAR
jgi:hypothetical protein